MANYNRRNNNIELSWGSGCTDLFLAPCEDGGLQLLDYEFDFDRIHEMCGGRCYYQSCSGASGAGYIEKYASLTRVGYYRVDTVHNEFQYPEKLNDEISIMLPYSSHESDKRKTLETNPVVIMIGDNTIIYCGFYTNMNEILATLLSGQELQQEPNILKRNFVNTKSYWKSSREVELKFYSMFKRSYYPWEFATDLLKDCTVYYPNERIHNIFRISTCEDGTLVRTTRIGQTLYATEVLKSDPYENVTEPISGWELAETNLLYKVRESEVYIVGWELAQKAYDKVVERVARFIPSSEAEEFKKFIREHLPSEKFVEYEVTVPKLLFFLNTEKQFAAIRKGIAKKVREDVFSAAKQFVNDFNDRQILDAIPDELVITIEDSWNSGNCQPGTQAFVDKYFPGKTETTAGELKKHADNWNVMRIFRYIATRDTITGKIKLVIPA